MITAAREAAKRRKMQNQTNSRQIRTDADPSAIPEKEKLTHKERRQRWKAAKKAKREEKKEYYRYAPPIKRWWDLYLWKPVVAILLIAMLVSVLYQPAKSLVSRIVMQQYNEIKDRPLSEEDMPKLYELSPLDEEGAARIGAYPAIGEDETWTICVYLVASDLEDMGENDLSYVTSLLTQEARAENSVRPEARHLEYLTRYDTELKENGLELPAFFYYPDKPVASSTVVTEDVTVAEKPGSASIDIGEMTAGVWSDNVSIVIQTGGATRWSNQMVNPNRTQRFLYKGGIFSEVANLPLEPASEPDTLADFLRFCKNEYPADHTMLVLWNHGGGPFGYGKDSIYSNMFSLKDIRTALSSVYTPNRNKPAFDIIGFDACLMSTLEVTHALDGFAQFYCLSEEAEPGSGWDYTPILQAMTDDPTMSPARVAQKVADSYIDFYMRENINQSIIQLDVTFSVIEAKKAAELYDAYSALCQAQLADAAEDMGVLAEIGRCAGRSTRYCGSDYNIVNTVDLGNYMDQLIDSYPEESSRVKELLGETVLYHRESGGLSDSTGMAVYVPADVTTIAGLSYYLDYIYDVCEDDSVAALYYYKQAGCLNDELKEALALVTDKEPKVLDAAAFRQFSADEPGVDDEGFRIPVSDQLQDLIVDYELEIGKYDETNDTLTYYGRTDCLTLDGEGHLVSSFDGKWICLDGQPLYLEVVSSTPAAVMYRSHVFYNGKNAYLELSRDRDTDEIRIIGVRKVPTSVEGDVNYLFNTRSNEKITFGARITPIYLREDFEANSISNVSGKQITFDNKTSLQMEALPSGQYLSTAVITDPRGDSYYSAVIASTMERNSMQNWRTDARFYARAYD